MARKVRQHPLGDPPAGVTHQYDGVKVNGRILSPKHPLKLTGRRGTYEFIRLVTRSDGKAWIDCFGPQGEFCSVRTDAIQTVRVKRAARSARR